MITLLRSSLVLVALAVTLVVAPVGARPPVQDCNNNGIPDSNEQPWSHVAVGDSFGSFTNHLDVLSNDFASSNFVGGACSGGTCDPNCGSSHCGGNTVQIITGPQHGNASADQLAGTQFHGQVAFAFSNSSNYCGDAEYFLYYWQDECGVKSNDAVVRISLPCPQSDFAFSTGGTNWIRVLDGGFGSSLDFTTGLTLECWVKPTSFAAGTGTLISKWGDTNVQDRAYKLSVLADGTIQFSVSTDGVHDSTLQAGVLSTGVWQHVTCTYDNAVQRIYLNANLVGEIHESGALFDAFTDLSIGAKLGSNGGQVTRFFDGSIDRVRVYDTALRRDQIQLDSNIRFLNGASFVVNGPAPISAWEMDQSTNDCFGLNAGTAFSTPVFVSSSSIPNTFFDCDGNGLPDYYDIAWHPNLDLDHNGILDSCEVHSFCYGDGSGHACPCNNTGSTRHGCNNSLSTGGSKLTVTGVASLGADTIQFKAVGENTSALSTVWQGHLSVGPFLFGDGLRCMGGTLKRLRNESAVAGVVTYPDGAETHVAARSAALGDPIPIGASRIYQISYRDPSATFCPPNTFNISGAIELLWKP